LEFLNIAISIPRRREDAIAAASYDNIGYVLNAKGDYDGAIAMYQKALTIRDAIFFREDHPSNAPTIWSVALINFGLAAALYGKEDYDGALVEFRKCLAIRKSAWAWSMLMQ
jgi:tetratricopeptide (TPR) repeat protein